MQQEIGLRFRFRVENEDKRRCYYWVRDDKLYCYGITGTKKNYEVSKYGVYMPVNISPVFPTIGRIHEIMYRNSRTDTWYDLVWHFMNSRGLIRLYNNYACDVVAHFNDDWDHNVYLLVKYGSFEVKYYTFDSPFAGRVFTAQIPEDRFYIMSDLFHDSNILNITGNNLIDELLVGFSVIIDDDKKYITMKMLKELIHGTEIRIADKLHDIKVMCTE